VDILYGVKKFLLKYGVEIKNRLVTIAPEALGAIVTLPLAGIFRDVGKRLIQRAELWQIKESKIDDYRII